MAFQFYCPQGHLLEAEAAQSGQQCNCPMCGAAMIIPPSPGEDEAVSQTAMAGAYEPSSSSEIFGEGLPGFKPPHSFPQQGYQDAFPNTGGDDVGEQPAFPGVQFGPQVGPGAGDESEPGEGPGEEVPNFSGPRTDDPDRIVRIICPQGHELHTPMSMVGTDAMCPHCSSQFRLRYEDSLEYQEDREKEAQRREEAFSRGALRWAIVMAVLVGLGLLGLIAVKSMG